MTFWVREKARVEEKVSARTTCVCRYNSPADAQMPKHACSGLMCIFHLLLCPYLSMQKCAFVHFDACAQPPASKQPYICTESSANGSSLQLKYAVNHICHLSGSQVFSQYHLEEESWCEKHKSQYSFYLFCTLRFSPVTYICVTESFTKSAVLLIILKLSQYGLVTGKPCCTIWFCFVGQLELQLVPCEVISCQLSALLPSICICH